MQQIELSAWMEHVNPRQNMYFMMNPAFVEVSSVMVMKKISQPCSRDI